ncbi:MAG: Lrp/AsnC family transcriptional regulator [Thermoplasmata archaeon]|nr:Lrp/AsnC family transcriptional regulator [Thermoplasmata archaeon]
MDEKDRKILEILMENARTPYTKIAEKIGLSEGAVRKRISSLESQGIIKKYVAIVDPRKIGYESISIIGFDAESNDLLRIANEVAKFEETKNVYISTGDHMIMTEVWCRNGRELSEFIANKIGKIKGIKRICPAIILEKIKD